MLSIPGSKVGVTLGPDFLLGRDGGVGSVREPREGAGPFRSRLTLSFSPEEGEERNKFNTTELPSTHVQINMTRKKGQTGTDRDWVDRMSMVQSGPLQ